MSADDLPPPSTVIFPTLGVDKIPDDPKFSLKSSELVLVHKNISGFS